MRASSVQVPSAESKMKRFRLVSLFGGENKGVLVAPLSFRLAGRFIGIAAQSDAGLGGELRATASRMVLEQIFSYD